MKETVIKTFMKSALKARVQVTAAMIRDLNIFLEKESHELLNGAFCGRYKLTEIFVSICYQEHILPVRLFGLLMRYFVISQGGGSYYRDKDKRTLFDMMSFAGFENMCREDEISFLESQPESIEVYRGGFAAGGLDMFWSMKQDFAFKFLKKGYHDFFWKATILKGGVLICKDDGSEIVFHPNAVLEKKVIGRINEDGVYCPVIEKGSEADL
jgi:hypothetical protein